MLPLKPSTNKKPPRQSQNFLRFAERRQGEVKQKEELGAMTARAVQAEAYQQVEVVDDGGFRIGSGVAPVASVGGLASGLDPFS